MTEVYVAVGHKSSRAVDLSVSYGPRDAFPHRPCEYMQPDQYAASKRAGRPYAYQQTSNLCTFVSLDLPTLRLDIVGVAAGLEADGVGLNYLNVKVRSWKHSMTQVSGILSHCFDGSLLGKKCPKCLGDRIGALQERPTATARVSAPKSSDLVTSGALGDRAHLRAADHERRSSVQRRSG